MLAISALLQSCVTGYYQRRAEPPPPPPPPPTCTTMLIRDPSTVRGLDTSKPTAPNVPYYVFQRMQGASTPLEEFGIVTADDEEHCLLIRGTDMMNAEYVVASKTGPSSVSSVPWDRTSANILVSAINNHNGLPDGSIATCTVADGTIQIDSTAPSINDPSAWDGHPTRSPSNRWVVFASNRSGSKNSTDLWYARRNADGSFGPARPLHGANTYCDEISPSFAPQAKLLLLFSSTGHTTFGGYDAFSVDLREDADSLIASNVVNLGQPMNSAFDEIFPSIAPNGTDLYVSSNRRDGRAGSRRDFDVFAAFLQSSGNQPLARLTGRVVNSQTLEPVVDAEVIAREKASRQVLASTRTDTAGSYSLNVPVSTPVQVTAKSDTLFYDSYTVVVPDTAAGRVVERFEPITLSRSFILRVNFPTSKFDDPYATTLDSNGMETDRTWQRELDELAASVVVSTVKVQKIMLIGHTDDVDTDESNRILGQQRVDFVIDKLVERGVARNLLQGTSAGERQPLPRRNGESIESWRKRCRRVELIKVAS